MDTSTMPTQLVSISGGDYVESKKVVDYRGSYRYYYRIRASKWDAWGEWWEA